MRSSLAALSLALLLASLAAAEDIGLRAPPGFEVSRFADDDLAHDIYSLTFDARGRVVVAGEGFVKRLDDDDRDGKADRATLLSVLPKSGAHGMCFDGDDLYCTGDHSILRIRAAGGDVRGPLPAETVVAGLKHTEHGTNAIVRGPDGWWYLSLGNDAGATAKLATTPGSPVKEPKQGVVLRYSPDFRQSEIVADGFRNPYDLAFGEQGNLLLVDADGERDQYLPWYSPTRLFDVATGMHHGWMIFGWQRSWNRPSYFCDNVERLVEIGRGSPTGSLVYRHTQFPPEYRGNFFSACWTLGKVYRFVLKPSGSTFTSEKQTFLETTGATGFAPVDLAIGPEGAMYVAIGGRKTRGSVFRLRFKGDDATPPDPTTVLEALRYPQPLDSWSRAKTTSILAKADPKEIAAVAADRMQSAKTRMRAVEALVEHHGGLDGRTARRLIISAKHETPELVARVAWAVGRTVKDPDWTLVQSLATHPERVVQRAALEALIASPLAGKALDPFRWGKVADDASRRIRAAAQLAGVDGEVPVLRDALDEVTQPATLFARLRRGKVDRGDFAMAVKVAKTQRGYSQRDALRYLELALGDVTLQGTPEVYTGYTLPKDVRPTAQQREILAELSSVPAWEDAVDIERVRLMAMAGIEDPDFYEHAPLGSYAAGVEESIHYLITLSLTPGERSEVITHYTALGLARLHHKMQKMKYVPSRFWPARVGEIAEALFQRDPKLAEELVKQEEFNLPAQALFVEKMTGETQLKAIRKLVAAAAKDENARWTPELVKLVAKLPRGEALPILRVRWEEFGLHEAILPVLAAKPAEEDRARFAEALESSEPAVVVAAAGALEGLKPPLGPDELLAAVSALRRFTLAKEYGPTREALVGLLEHGTDQTFEIDERGAKDVTAAYQPWFAWFARKHPELAKKLGGLDAAEWQARVGTIPWAAGDVARGKVVFERRSCAKCHAGENRFGPDLAGAGGRFSNADLLAAIVDPSKDVAPTYKTVQVETASGKVFTGLVVYESPESTLLATGPDTSLRVTGEEITAMRPSRLSLMPAGLLQGATDQEIADLVAYLKTLKGP